MIANIWHKSVRSGAAGHCVEVFWKKSTRSNPSGNCVEVKSGEGGVMVRDTKLGDASPVLNFTQVDWLALIGEIKNGATCPVSGPFEVRQATTGFDLVESRDGEQVTLHFTDPEWAAFVGGVNDGEFDLKSA